MSQPLLNVLTLLLPWAWAALLPPLLFLYPLFFSFFFLFLFFFCFFLFFLLYLFIYQFFFLLFHIYADPVSSCLELGIGFTFPGCCTSQYHGATTLFHFPPTTLTLHQPYWLGSCLLTPITLHLSLYKPHTKSYQLSSWISWPLQMGLIKVKVKFPCYRPGVAQRVRTGIALLFHDHGTRGGWVVSSTPRPHFTPMKEPVPIL